MLNTLASHNEDLSRLLKKGYAVSIDSNHLVVRDIPYLDNSQALQIGAIVSKLIFIDNEHVKLEDHQIFFCGSHPCEINGNLIPNLGGGPVNIPMESEDLVVQRSFSNKPENGFADLFEKIESYVTIFSGPAMQLHDVTPYTFRVVAEVTTSPFKFRDTLTSRAEIGDLVLKVKDDNIAIIGLGGTGSYILDFLVKTPVNEIRGFDLDWFHTHNGFRSPGKIEEEELGKRKAEVYQKRYEGFRSGINIQSKYILADSQEDLKGVTFAFVCVDKGPARLEIINLLSELKIPFIDVGMGLDRTNDLLSGTLRVTSFTGQEEQDSLSKNNVPFSDIADDEYKNNIQISELNALNACLAVIKYKQIRGFYMDDNNFYHMLFNIDSLSLNGQ
jgi:hypothetical protein